MVSAPARRQQVAYARGRGVSSRRACVLLSVARSTLTYRSRRTDQDRPVLTVMRGLAAQYPRYGYRRIRIFLAREGHVLGAERTHRLWRAAGLQVPRRRPRRRVAASRPRPQPAHGRNEVWAYDFVFDHCANGQRLKCLTVVDEFTREWFRNRVEARVGIDQWRRHYNEVRPHSSLGYRTPAEFKASCLTERPVDAVLQ